MNKSFICLAALCGIFFIAAIGCDETAAAPEKKPNWLYKSGNAIIYSLDKDGFRDEKNIPLLIRNNGEIFLISSSGKCDVKFDDEAPIDWECSSIYDIDIDDDGFIHEFIEVNRTNILAMGLADDIILFEKPQEFILKLAKAKKLTISGVEFGNVGGLEWPQTAETTQKSNSESNSSCRSGSKTPEEITEKYIMASLSKDYGKMKSLASEKKKERLAEEEKEYKERHKKLSPKEKEFFTEVEFKLKRITPKCKTTQINEYGDKARIEFSLNKFSTEDEFALANIAGDEAEAELVKEKNAWKINLFSIDIYDEEPVDEILFENIESEDLSASMKFETKKAMKPRKKAGEVGKPRGKAR